MKIFVRRGRKTLDMNEHLDMLMNPRKMSDDEDVGLSEIRILDEEESVGDEFDTRSASDGRAASDTPFGGANFFGGDDSDTDAKNVFTDVLPDIGDDEDDDGIASDNESVEEVGRPQQPPPFHQTPPAMRNDFPPRPPQPSREEVNNAKRELLYRFDRLEKKGIRLPRRYSMASDYAEMQADYDRLVNDRNADAGIKFQKKVLVAVVSGIEFMNRKFDPFEFQLDGWSETVTENLSEYDDVLEELHAKHKGKVHMAPELKLLMMLVGSAFMYHLTKTMFKSAPALGQVMQDNPDLMKQFAAATANTMQKNDAASGGGMGGLAGMFGSMFGGGGPSASTNSPPPVPPPAMRGPSSNRIAEVQRFIQGGSGGGVPNAASRPPLPQTGRDIKPIKEQPPPNKYAAKVETRDIRGDEDLVEILSAASDISEVTAGGSRRKKRVLQL